MQPLSTIPSLAMRTVRALVPIFCRASGRQTSAAVIAVRQFQRWNRRSRNLVFGAALGIGLCLVANELRAQTTLGFDPPSLPAITNFSLVPNGYGGLNWDNVYYINQSYLAGSGYDHGTVSAPNAAFNGFGSVSMVTDPTPGDYFNFDSADLTAAWIPGLQIQVDGFNTNFNAVTPIYSTTLTVGTAAPTLVDFSTLGGGFLGVNKLTFTSFVAGGGGGPNPAGTQFAMDDFKFTTTSLGGTPEPGSLVLATLGAGGLALGAWRKRAHRRQAS